MSEEYTRENPRDFSPSGEDGLPREGPARVTANELLTILSQGKRTVERREFGFLVKDHDKKVEWLFMAFSPGNRYHGDYDVGYL